jgi:hypothetical protein
LFPGVRFDAYPGDAAVRRWAADSPYRFVVLPLGHPGWSGTGDLLRTLGFGLAVLYAGHHGTSRAQGATDAHETISYCRRERLPLGTVCYLDQRDTDLDYVRGWIGTVLDSRHVLPGIRCSSEMVAQLAVVARTESADHGRTQCPLWIIGGDHGDVIESPTHQTESFGGIALDGYRCRATTKDPSRSAGRLAPASVAEVRRLVDSCLGTLGRLDWDAPPFPRGVDSVEIDVTTVDGATTARVRIQGPSEPPATT